MRHRHVFRYGLIAISALVMGLGSPLTAEAQTVSGSARAAQVTISSPLGITTTTLSDTGSLSGTSDARDASQASGAVGTTLRGDTLHATTIGWPDQVASEASIANVAMTVQGLAVEAGFVMSRASASATAAGSVTINGLTVNGVAVDVTGASNQRVELPGAVIVINEQQPSSYGIVVNGLHVIVDGLADVLIASASAAIQ
jgi:hypothetical protein